MSLQTAVAYNSLTFSQIQLNPGFSSTYQGPDTFAYSSNFTIDQYNMNAVWAAEGTLSPSASTTINLQNVTDFFNNTLVLTRIYGIQIGVTGGDLQLSPAATNGQQWFFTSLADGLVIKAGGDFMYNTSSAFLVDAGTSSITLTNLSGTSDAVYKLAILGGTGPMVTPTPLPTASPVPTPNPTGTAVPTPTPTVTYFVTPTFTPSPT